MGTILSWLLDVGRADLSARWQMVGISKTFDQRARGGVDWYPSHTVPSILLCKDLCIDSDEGASACPEESSFKARDIPEGLQVSFERDASQQKHRLDTRIIDTRRGWV